MTEPGGVRAASPWSLRRRLLVAIVAASTVLWLASLGTVTAIAWQETGEVFDDALEESAYMLLAATDGNERPAPPRMSSDQERKVDMQYQIVTGGQVVRRTAGAPYQPFVAGVDDGFTDIALDNRRWRVFVVRDETRGVEVQVGQQYTKRLDILEELAEALWLPVLCFLVLLSLVSWWLIGRVLKPLRQTAAAIAGKSRDDLTQVAIAGQPRELLPIVGALNSVLGRLDGALKAERRFTADAAHELRTPLAALHMKLQLLQRQHPGLESPFQGLRQDIARMTSVVDSLLMLARLDPMGREQLVRQPVALRPLLEQVFEVQAPEANQRGIALSMRCTLDAVAADPQLLAIMLRNLLENALRYCPDGSRVEVEASRVAGRAHVIVRDDGPGVDEASRQRLAERFFRVLGQGQGGSGLGLSIVKRIADLHGIALAFGPGLDGRGLGVSLAWPPDGVP